MRFVVVVLVTFAVFLPTGGKVWGQSIVTDEFKAIAVELTNLAEGIPSITPDSLTEENDSEIESFYDYLYDFDRLHKKGLLGHVSGRYKLENWLSSTDSVVEKLERIVSKIKRNNTRTTSLQTDLDVNLWLFQHSPCGYTFWGGSPVLWTGLFRRISYGAVAAVEKGDYRQAVHLLSLGWTINSSAAKHIAGHEAFKIAVERQSQLMTIWLSIPSEMRGDNSLDTWVIKPGLDFLVACHRYDCQCEIATSQNGIEIERAKRHLAALTVELRGLPEDDNGLLGALYDQLTAREGQPGYEGIGVPAIPTTMASRRAFNLDRLTMKALQILHSREHSLDVVEKLSQLNEEAKAMGIAAKITMGYESDGQLKCVSVALPRMTVNGTPNANLLGMDQENEYPRSRRILQ